MLTYEQALARALLLMKSSEIVELGARNTIRLIEKFAQVLMEVQAEVLKEAEAQRHGMESARAENSAYKHVLAEDAIS